MESPSTQTPAKKEKKGLKKYWSKIKAAFKDTPSSSGPSTVAPKPAATTISSAPEAESAGAVSSTKAPEVTKEEPPTSKQEVDRRLEKARAIFKKYDFEFDEKDWELSNQRPKQPAERVQKNIRMRVKYTCHNCKTTYGHDRICISCQHKRCPECVRYPVKKIKNKAAKVVPGVEPEEPVKKDEHGCSCHECQTGFDVGVEECPNCKHKICDKCQKSAVLSVQTPPKEEPNKSLDKTTPPAVVSAS